VTFNEELIRSALPNVTFLGKSFDFINPSISFDTRSLKKGDIFIALSGKQTDGHLFLLDAIERGAIALIISHEKKHLLADIERKILQKLAIVIVQDVKKALIACAFAWRQQFDYSVIGITGSAGKTSAKEKIAHVCRSHGMRIVVSPGNFNTLLGVAITIFSMRDYHDIAIFEMGISQRGEMRELADLVRPSIGIITNIGHQHMDTFGSLQDIAFEKRQIFSFFTEKNIGIIFGNESLLLDVAYPHPVIRFGTKTINHIQARKIKRYDDIITFVLKVYKKKYTILLKSTHEGDIFNALVAVTVGFLLKIPIATVVQAIETPVKVSGRFKSLSLKKYKGVVIDDSYNASPETVKAAFIALDHAHQGTKKIAVLGDMCGLGVDAPFWHRQIGRFLRKISTLDHIILVGNEVQWVKKTLRSNVDVDTVANWREALVVLRENLQDDITILVKGSRSMELDNVVELLTQK
jgi:UDP-N-acetylmuramoyl-tripeptide--D-alanyl-D-alanine ligase